MTLGTSTAFSRLRTDDPYYIEGIPTTLTDESLSRAVEGADGQWFSTSGERILYRGGCCGHGELCGLFTFNVNNDPSNSNWNNGCRLARELQDTILRIGFQGPILLDIVISYRLCFLLYECCPC